MFASIEVAIEEFITGRIIVIYDDVGGEEEGDLVCAAELVTPENLNFMSAYGRGLVYVPIIGQRLDDLKAVPIYNVNSGSNDFEVYAPIDYKGSGTGSSPYDKADTILKLLDPDSKPGDFHCPGHVFPMRAKDKGLLEKVSHGNASVDLARIAGLYPAGVICEIVGEDGYMASLPELQRFCLRHHLKMIAISHIIAWLSDNAGKTVSLEQLRAKLAKPSKGNSPKQAYYTFEHIVGHSPQILSAIATARAAAKTDCRILLQGETGTGKEMFAQSIHNSSIRQKGPFIGVNCAAIPESLLESELFGYADGAFTGAGKGGKPGCFELAKGGTLFLDEIDSLPFHMQAKLLRVLQENRLMRVGGTKNIELDVRIVAASSKHLDQESAGGHFRRDLYYRLSVVVINLPPLRERIVDIPALTYILANNLGNSLRKDIRSIADSVIDQLQSYDWPGNVRELANVIERALILNPSNTVLLTDIQVGDAPEDALKPLPLAANYSAEEPDLAFNLYETEKNAVLSALSHTGNNIAQAAKLLGVDRKTLYRKIKAYGL